MNEYFRNQRFEEFLATTFQEGRRSLRGKKNIQDERKKDPS